jgi:hypothetical protein
MFNGDPERWTSAGAIMVSRLLSASVHFGSSLVGVVLLLAGLAKALDPQNFSRYLGDLRLVSSRFVPSVTFMLVILQCGLGAALVISLWLRWLMPATILLLVALASLSSWAIRSGRTPDCGCYNGIVTFSPEQSLILDAVYVVLLACGWRWGTQVSEPEPWKIASVLVIAAGAGLLAYVSLRHEAETGKPLLELSPLRPGRRWNLRWMKEGSDVSRGDGKKIVVFLGASCHYCRRWIKVLNVVHRLPGFPDVQGIVLLPDKDLSDYVSREGVEFPVTTAKPWVMARLVRGFTPTAVVVEGGVIQEKWIGSMPEPFVEELRALISRSKSENGEGSSPVSSRG